MPEHNDKPALAAAQRIHDQRTADGVPPPRDYGEAESITRKWHPALCDQCRPVMARRLLELGRAQLPISQEAARGLLAALKLLLEYEPGGAPPLTMPRGLAIDQARAAVGKAERREA